ncbi:MAG: NADP-dependent isocitrate dehydrogenase [Fimbriimonadaceae bacterium]|nr:NADP-dependent isocitrate dehydrogenase [Fimbriimonadaceae bacterium]
MAAKRQVTVIPGDGVGPEVVRAAQQILEAAGAQIEWEECAAGESVFLKGLSSGVPQETIDSIARTRCVLKGPLGTPVGYGEKSANVTLRKLFETFGNIRPVRELPGIVTPYTGRGVDFVVVRENVEDLYAGIEHAQTAGVMQCLKLISRKGCEKIARLAFEFARAEGRKSVACATKSNIMKMTEGLLKRTFEAIAPEYPEIEAWHIIIDNAAHQMVKQPEQFDVVVTTNMNGDIISDLASGLVGGLGFAPSANLGNGVAIFEAVHGSAPKYAGKNVINPTALVLSAVMMLRYLGDFTAAAAVENAVLVTLAEGRAMTQDVVRLLAEKPDDLEPCSTTAFTEAVIANLGKVSETVKVRDHKPIRMPEISTEPEFVKGVSSRDIGADIFVQANTDPVTLGDSLTALAEGSPLKLKMISNRGTRVYPPTGTSTDCIDQWRCRFILRDAAGTLQDADLLALLARIGDKYRWMHLEKLPLLDEQPGFTMAQGED